MIKNVFYVEVKKMMIMRMKKKTDINIKKYSAYERTYFPSDVFDSSLISNMSDIDVSIFAREF